MRSFTSYQNQLQSGSISPYLGLTRMARLLGLEAERTRATVRLVLEGLVQALLTTQRAAPPTYRQLRLL